MKKTSEMNGFLRSSAFAKAATCLLLASGGGVSAAYAESMKAPDASVTEVQQAKVTVTGVVKDAQGEPIIGASVMEKGTSNGAISDLDGKFSLNVKPGAQLVVSYVGYVSKEVKAGKNISVTLEEDNKLINEVVVVGYGTQRKGDITSSIASVKSEDFAKGKIGDAAELIKGKIAGLSITNTSGDPTAGSHIMLRGVNTLEGSNTPLVLIDGVQGDMTTVAPENIAEIDVLKDASAAAIYGTRGANGVILITTKNGRRDARPEITYNGYVSFSDWTKTPDFMTTNDVIYGRTPYTYGGYDTDWMKAITRKAGFKHNHSLTVSGGSANSMYSANVTYSDEQGIMRKSGNRDLKMQIDYTQFAWNDMLKFNFNGLMRRRTNPLNNNEYAYRQAIIRNPSEPIYNEDGSYYEDKNIKYYYNPVEIQNEYEGESRDRFYQMTGSVSIEPIKGWETKVALTMNENVNKTQSYQTHEYYTMFTKDVENFNGYAYQGEGSSRMDQLEITSRFHKNWNNVHRFEALVGYSYQYDVYDGFSAGNGNFSTNAFKWNNLGNGTYITDEDNHASVGSDKYDSKLVGFFGRVSYGYADKYNALISLRHEGSSKFGDNHKWATFPSVSLGWTISNESFMKDTKNWLDNLKLRVGYGVTGVTPTSSYMSQSLYAFDSYGDILSKDGEWIKTLQVSQNVNKDLKWETSREWNFGLDWSLFKGRLTGSLDVYVKTTSDLLYWYDVPSPPNLYTSTLANVGKIRNTGYELMISGIPVKTKDFEWSTTVTVSQNKNKLLSLSNTLYETEDFHQVGGLGEPISTETHCMEVGYALGEFWGLEYAGVNKDGMVLVWAKNTDGEWTRQEFNSSLNKKENRKRLGSGTPKVYLGWGHQFRYKNFDLAVQFTGQFGYKILNAWRCFYESNGQAYNRLKTAADLRPAINTDGTPYLDEDGNQVMVTLSKSCGQGFWSDHLENGDFLKLTNLTLGYNVPLKGSITKFITGARIYLSATNLFCITGYSGLDPEVDNYSIMSPGIDYQDKYPTTRSYTIGLNFNF